jgi:hypothetical protein
MPYQLNKNQVAQSNGHSSKNKPKVSTNQNINEKIITVQITMEEFSRFQS